MGPVSDVALVIDSLARGGAEKVALAQANSLDTNGFYVHVVTTRAPGDLVTELKPSIQFHNLGRNRRWDLKAFRCFSQIINENNIHIVHSHNHSSSYFTRFASLFSPEPWIHVMHDHHGPVESDLRIKMLDRLLLHDVEYYFGVSKNLVQYAVNGIGIPQRRCQYLPNGVQIPPHTDCSLSDEFTIVQVGRVVPVKNHLMAIKAAAQLKTRMRNFQWLIVGRKDARHQRYVTECQETLEKLGMVGKVAFVGEKQDVFSILQRAHVGVLTSHHEGFPMVLLEYMACGLPVIVTDVGQCGSLVRECGGGVVIEENNTTALVDALAMYAKDQKRADVDGRKNRECVSKRYSVETMTNQIIRVYDQLLH